MVAHRQLGTRLRLECSVSRRACLMSEASGGSWHPYDPGKRLCGKSVAQRDSRRTWHVSYGLHMYHGHTGRANGTGARSAEQRRTRRNWPTVGACITVMEKKRKHLRTSSHRSPVCQRKHRYLTCTSGAMSSHADQQTTQQLDPVHGKPRPLHVDHGTSKHASLNRTGDTKVGQMSTRDSNIEFQQPGLLPDTHIIRTVTIPVTRPGMMQIPPAPVLRHNTFASHTREPQKANRSIKKTLLRDAYCLVAQAFGGLVSATTFPPIALVCSPSAQYIPRLTEAAVNP